MRSSKCFAKVIGRKEAQKITKRRFQTPQSIQRERAKAQNIQTCAFLFPNGSGPFRRCRCVGPVGSEFGLTGFRQAGRRHPQPR